MDSYFGRKQFKVKTSLRLTHSLSLHKTLTDVLESCGLLVDYCDDSHSDGTHSLQRIHW